jgi:hypothetical protein
MDGSKSRFKDCLQQSKRMFVWSGQDGISYQKIGGKEQSSERAVSTFIAVVSQGEQARHFGHQNIAS